MAKQATLTQQRYRQIHKVNVVSSVTDLFLTAIKFVVGTLASSPALIADALHSATDLITDILAMALNKASSFGPDIDHHYGHARYETLGTAIIGVVLIAVACGIIYESILALVENRTSATHWLALSAVIVSIVVKEALFQYTIRQARQTESKLLTANAWHSRSDSLSSLVVFIGIGFSLLGFHYLEYVAAIGVGLFIARMGIVVAWDAMQDLIDRGVSKEKIDAIRETLASVPGISDPHHLRTRKMGDRIFMDTHIRMDKRVSISEAHQINDLAIKTLKQTFDDIEDITMHIDFEPRDQEIRTRLSPKRQAVEALLLQHQISGFDELNLHYEKNQVVVQLVYQQAFDEESVKAKASALSHNTAWINAVEVLKRIN